jgi:hypothetical protein
MNILYTKPLPKGLLDSDTKEDNDKEVEDVYKNNDNIMAPKNRKSPTNTPKKKKPMDLLAEGVCGLSFSRKIKMWSFKVNDIFFIKEPFTKTKERYVSNFCEVDIFVGTLIPQENLLFALSPDSNHIIYKKALPEMFGEADPLRLEMENKILHGQLAGSCTPTHLPIKAINDQGDE